MFYIYKAVIYKIDLCKKTVEENLYGYYEDKNDAIDAYKKGSKYCYEEDGVIYKGAVHTICVNHRNEK